MAKLKNVELGLGDDPEAGHLDQIAEEGEISGCHTERSRQFGRKSEVFAGFGCKSVEPSYRDLSPGEAAHVFRDLFAASSALSDCFREHRPDHFGIVD